MYITSKNKNNINISLFSSLLAVALTVLCLYMRKEMNASLEYKNMSLVLGFALCCLNISSLVFFRKLSFNRNQVICVFVVLLFPLLISWIHQYYFRYFFYVGYPLFAITIWKSFKVKFWNFSFLCFALGITFLHLVPAIMDNNINAANPVFLSPYS